MEILHAFLRSSNYPFISHYLELFWGGRLRLILTPGSGLGRASTASGKIKLLKHKGHLYEMQRTGRNNLLEATKGATALSDLPRASCSPALPRAHSLADVRQGRSFGNQMLQVKYFPVIAAPED